MTVTIVQRWIVPNLPATTELAKRAKATWAKHGSQDLRFNQIFTGQFTGQFMTAIVFADMAAYAKASAGMTAGEGPQLVADLAKIGTVMQEREILLSVDL